jgi:predicted kinase
MPLFLSLRAAIRAHVTASAGGDADEAQAYLNQACAALHPPAAWLIAIGGLSGSGKSTVAAALAPELGARPGARLLRSDVIRKRLFGTEPEARLPEDAYKPEVTARVYERLCAQAEAALRAGYSAIIDAVSLWPEERHSFASVAAKVGVPFTGIWLDAPSDALATRMTARRNDASDATAEIVSRQLGADPGPIDWHRIEALGTMAETLTAVKQALAPR